MITEPSNYNIAIRKDGELFRIPKHLDYSDEIPKKNYNIVYWNGKCALKNKYFNVHGELRERYWCLRRIPM